MATKHIRKLGNVPYVSGAPQTLEIDRDEVLLRLWVRVQFTVTNGSSAAVGPLFETLARIIRRLEVVAGGRDTVWSVNGEHIAARVYYENAIAAEGMQDTVVLTGSNTATAYDVILPIDFTLPRGRRPDDTGLDTRGLSQLSLRVTWANSDCSAIYTTPNGAAISGVTCSIEGEYLLGVDPAQPFLVRALDTVSREVTGTSDNFDIIMDRGTGLLYRSFLITTLANDLGVNTMLDAGDIELSAGSFNYRVRNGKMLRGANRTEYNIASKAGCYLINVPFAGQSPTMINTTRLTSDLKLIFDVTKVTGTNFIHVQREAVRPLKIG